jgi:hypothetical protein
VIIKLTMTKRQNNSKSDGEFGNNVVELFEQGEKVR